MKNRLYKAIYEGKEYSVFAMCEEDAYWKVLIRNGIVLSGDVDKIVVENKMEIFLA